MYNVYQIWYKFELSIYIETVDGYSLQKTIRVVKNYVKGLCFIIWIVYFEQVFNFYDALWLDGILYVYSSFV